MLTRIFGKQTEGLGLGQSWGGVCFKAKLRVSYLGQIRLFVFSEDLVSKLGTAPTQ